MIVTTNHQRIAHQQWKGNRQNNLWRWEEGDGEGTCRSNNQIGWIASLGRPLRGTLDVLGQIPQTQLLQYLLHLWMGSIGQCQGWILPDHLERDLITQLQEGMIFANNQVGRQTREVKAGQVWIVVFRDIWIATNPGINHAAAKILEGRMDLKVIKVPRHPPIWRRITEEGP